MLLKTFKTSAILNIKNLVGWKTERKLVIFSVDDYGNVRLDSKKAREKMSREGLKIYNRFDAFDSLETRSDLEALFDVLTSVKDHTGRYTTFTAFAVPCNINFERMAETGYKKYHYELLPETYQKLSNLNLSSYTGTWDLWKEGIREGLIVPQFHGREHLNLKIFEEKLKAGEHDLMVCLKNRSFTSIKHNGVSPTAAFDFWQFEENNRFHNVIRDGLNQFENVFGLRAKEFTPPAYKVHPVLNKTLQKHGIQYKDTAMITNEHQGKGRYKRKFNYTGKQNDLGQTFIIRNVVFEPTQDRGIDWVAYTLKQIEAAFRWNRPAIISSHRVNFCGHIDENNRKKGLMALQELLKNIIQRWPDVEFMAANELGALIESDKNKIIKK